MSDKFEISVVARAATKDEAKALFLKRIEQIEQGGWQDQRGGGGGQNTFIATVIGTIPLTLEERVDMLERNRG